MENVLHGEFWVIAMFLVLVLTLVVVGGFLAYVAPVIGRLNKGDTGGEKSCCPSGVGCNDPHPEYQACRRIKAQQLASPEEFAKLDELWANYNSVSRRNRKQKREALEAFSAFRDGVIGRALQRAHDNGGKLHVPLLEAKEAIGKSKTESSSYRREM